MKRYVFKNAEFGTEKEDMTIAYLFDSTLLPIDDLKPLAKR